MLWALVLLVGTQVIIPTTISRYHSEEECTAAKEVAYKTILKEWHGTAHCIPVTDK